MENGANVNAKKQGGLTAVYEASLKGYLDIVKILVDNGADFTIPTDEGVNAFHAAVIGYLSFLHSDFPLEEELQ